MPDPNTIRNDLINLKIQINNELENVRTTKNSFISNSNNRVNHFFPEQKIQQYTGQISNKYDEINVLKNDSDSFYNKTMKNVGDEFFSLFFSENDRHDIPLFIYKNIFENLNNYNTENDVYNFFNLNFNDNKALELLIPIIIDNFNSDTKKNKHIKESIDSWFKKSEKKYSKFKQELTYLKEKKFLNKEDLDNLFNLYSTEDLIILKYSQSETNNLLYMFNTYFGDNYNDSTISGEVKNIISNSITQLQTHSEIIEDAFYRKDISLNLNNRVLNLLLNKTIKKMEFSISSFLSISKKKIDNQLKNDKVKIKKNIKNLKKNVKENLNNNLSFHISEFNIRYKERHHSEYSRDKIKKDLDFFNKKMYDVIDSDIKKMEDDLIFYLDEIFNSNKSSYMTNISDEIKNKLNDYISKNKSKFLKQFKKESDFFHQNIKNKYEQLINNKKNIIIKNTKNKLNSLFLNFIYDIDKDLYFCDWSTKLYIYNLYYSQYNSLLNNIYDTLLPVINLNLDLNNVNNLITNSNNQVNNQIEIDYNNIDIPSIVSKSFN